MDISRPNLRPALETDAAHEPPASIAVRRLLLSQGVREHNHASEIARIIGVDRSQTYRRLKGEVAWSASDLRAVARHFGSSQDSLLASLTPGAEAASLQAVPASIRIARLPAQGLLVPGTALAPGERADLVAVPGPAGWAVYADGDEPLDLPRHAVASLMLRSQPLLRVALLEDDALAAQALVEAFRPLGVIAFPFHVPGALMAAAGERPFDAFVLDWLLGGSGTAAPVVEAIRSVRPHVPIMVVTGALADEDTERLLFQLSAKWNFSTLDKPVRPINLANALKQLVSVGRD